MTWVLKLTAAAAASLIATTAFAAPSRPSQGRSTERAQKTVESEMDSAISQIADGKYRAALRRLRWVIKEDPQNADAHNMAGFASRKRAAAAKDDGNERRAAEFYGDSEEYYAAALAINPAHRDAIEYQGELYLQTDRPDQARENLELLRELCPSGCPQLALLEDAVSAFERGDPVESAW